MQVHPFDNVAHLLRRIVYRSVFVDMKIRARTYVTSVYRIPRRSEWHCAKENDDGDAAPARTCQDGPVGPVRKATRKKQKTLAQRDILRLVQYFLHFIGNVA